MRLNVLNEYTYTLETIIQAGQKNMAITSIPVRVNSDLRQWPAGTEIVGRLIDISASGFRAAHGCATMTSGEVVGYSYAQNQGRARVVWSRVIAGADPTVESGFVILAET